MSRTASPTAGGVFSAAIPIAGSATASASPPRPIHRNPRASFIGGAVVYAFASAALWA